MVLLETPRKNSFFTSFTLPTAPWHSCFLNQACLLPQEQRESWDGELLAISRTTVTLHLSCGCWVYVHNNSTQYQSSACSYQTVSGPLCLSVSIFLYPILWPRSSIFVGYSTRATYPETSNWASILGGVGGWKVRVGRTLRSRGLLAQLPFQFDSVLHPKVMSSFQEAWFPTYFPPHSLFFPLHMGWWYLSPAFALSCIVSIVNTV